MVRSAVLYVLRLLIAEPLPLNEGILRAVEIRIPPGMLNPPFPDDPAEAPAVVGGNVETSQRVVDTLLKALGLAACSQGTMNNLLFGNERFGFYETVCGGAGAGPGFDGASAVHTHMTNTRITDPEAAGAPLPRAAGALRHPPRLGRGRPLAGRRRRRPRDRLPGADVPLPPLPAPGGAPLRRGRRRARASPDVSGSSRATGEVEDLASIDGREVGPGDRLILETPGGGGWGLQGETS